MTYVEIDTNIWIYLTNDTLFELWKKLVESVEKREIEIFINDLILLEWQRNKETTIKNLTLNIKNEYHAAKKLANYLNADKKEQLLAIITDYKDEDIRIKKAERRVEEVEAFTRDRCTVITVSNPQKLFISELAINNKPPFHTKKNNYNDALIIRNLCEYIQATNYHLHDLLYVSNNPDDFTDKTTGKIHSDLLAGLHVRLTSVTDLGHALRIAPSLVDEIDEQLEHDIDSWIQYQIDLSRGK